jgi:hypothetical protein
MHRSRLVGILIDTPAAQVDAAAGFWSAALGAQPYPAPQHSPLRRAPGPEAPAAPIATPGPAASKFA